MGSKDNWKVGDITITRFIENGGRLAPFNGYLDGEGVR